MTEVGFKRMKIQPYDTDWKPAGSPIVLEGKMDEGATSTAEITGLSKDPVRVPGSDIDYYISRKGVGEVKVNFGILDFPDGESDKVLGYKVDPNGLTYIGNDTEAPYCGVQLESETLQGDKVLLGFLKGVFARDAINLKTKDTKEAFTPEATAYTFSAVASTEEGPQNGQYVVKYIGSEETAIAELEKEVLGTPVTTPPAG